MRAKGWRGHGVALTVALTLAAGTLGGCADYEAPRALPALDLAAYRCNVEPVLAARCAFFACHGSATRPFRLYAAGRLRLEVGNVNILNPLTEAESDANFEMALGFAGEERAGSPWLLAKPLDVRSGGLFHVGLTRYDDTDVFESTTDLGYQKLAAWIAGGTAAADCAADTAVGP